MKTNKQVLLLFYFLLSTFYTYSQEQGLKTIVQEDLKRHLSFISSDSLQGRTFETENRGLEMAAEYIKVNIKKAGLISGADDYSQAVNIISVKPDFENSFLKINSKKNKQTFSTQSVICLSRFQKSIHVIGNVVFAGFGIKDEKLGYNDFEGLNLKEKIVLISEGSIQSFKSAEGQLGDNTEETEKMKYAFDAGAKAVVLIADVKDKKHAAFTLLKDRLNRKSYSIKKEEEPTKNDNFFMVTTEVADNLLGGKGKYKKYLASVSRKGKSNSFELENREIEINIQKRINEILSENVIGFIEGSDLELKKEYVFYMAHYDHLGVDKNGDVYNGADDNGSGIAVLLELAEAFNSLPVKPKRSIVFLWVTGEEYGMFGSDWYTQNPVFPLDKTFACINIDMVGRVYEPRDSVWNKSPKMVKDFDGLFTLTNDVWPELNQISDSVCSSLNLVPDNSLPKYFLRSSDHYHFHKNEIPILNVATGYHADYHKPTDEISRINFDKMKRVADFCFLVGMEVANREK